MLEAQAPVKADLQQIIDYAGVLVKAGLIEMPPPAPAKAGNRRRSSGAGSPAISSSSKGPAHN